MSNPKKPVLLDEWSDVSEGNLANVIPGPWTDLDQASECIVSGVPIIGCNAEDTYDSALCSASGAPPPNTVDTNLTASHSLDIQSLSGKEVRAKYKREHGSWRSMRQKCRNKEYTCDPAFDSFTKFLAILGPKPDADYTLDRIDFANPEYSPKNCRWASKQCQTWNRKNTRFLTHPKTGKALPIAEWSRRLDVSINTLRGRVKKGWNDAEVLFGRTSRLNNKTYGDVSCWEEMLPGSSKEEIAQLEQCYKRSRIRYDPVIDKYERRSVWCLRYFISLEMEAKERILQIIPYDETGDYQVATELENAYQDAHVNKASCLAYVYKKYDRRIAVSIVNWALRIAKALPVQNRHQP